MSTAARTSASINLTPIIDIVLLLIIFLVLVNNFTRSEETWPEVRLPENCAFAQTAEGDSAVTVTLKTNSDGSTEFFVDDKQMHLNTALQTQIKQRINSACALLPEGRRIVVLRADKDVPFRAAQFALAAIAESNAVRTDFAVSKQ